ncbi:hypothetical protein DFS34DRAFT_659743 [Phlyctochytrium arcticum]|nr:hypothetical protein DFS34DRAFT_659743 [Phlyctochytrium arcticum]
MTRLRFLIRQKLGAAVNFGGVDIAKLLHQVQKTMLKALSAGQTVDEDDPAITATLLSCIIISANPPFPYREHLAPEDWPAILSVFKTERFKATRLEEASFAEKVENLILDKMRNNVLFPEPGKDEKESRCNILLGNLYHFLKPSQIACVTEPTWTAMYLWPLFGVTFKNNMIVKLDAKADSRKRPDILFYVQMPDGPLRLIGIAEVKTTSATSAARKKEMSRLLKRGVAAIRKDVAQYDHGTDSPTLILGRFDGCLLCCIQTPPHLFICFIFLGTEGFLSQLSPWEKNFVCYDIGKMPVPVAFETGQEDSIAQAVVRADSLMVVFGVFVNFLILLGVES